MIPNADSMVPNGGPSSAGGSGSLTVGTTPIAGGTSGQALIDNAGVLGNAPIRTLAVSDLTFYVATTGSDSNPGTIGQPFATLQYAWDHLSATYDLSIYQITINLEASGTAYTLSATNGWIGGSNVNIVGAGSGSMKIAGATFNPMLLGPVLNFDSVTLADQGSGSCLFMLQTGLITTGQINGDVVIDSSANAASFAQIYGNGVGCLYQGRVNEITGSSGFYTFADGGAQLGNFSAGGATVITGTPAYSGAFEAAQGQGSAIFDNVTPYSGPATGTRFYADQNAVINLNAGGEPTGTALPGDQPGILQSGAQYAGLITQSVVMPASGDIVSMALLQPNLILKPAGLLGTLTVNLPPIPAIPAPLAPSSPIDGVRVAISTTQIVSALTIATTDGSAPPGAPTTLAADTAFALLFDETSNSWSLTA